MCEAAGPVLSMIPSNTCAQTDPTGPELHYRLDRDKVERPTDVDLTIGGPTHVPLHSRHLREVEQVEHWKLADDLKRVLSAGLRAALIREDRSLPRAAL